MSARQESLFAQTANLRRQVRAERRWSTITLWIGVTIVGGAVVGAVFAPLIAPFSPDLQDLAATLQAPSWHHLMGTDELGRDILSRVVYAGRVDLVLATVMTYVPLTMGIVLGAVAGYFGGWIDSLIMRLVDVMIAFPFIVLIIAVLAVVGPGAKGMIIAVIAVSWSIYARLTRAEMLVLREQEFVLAAQGLGLSTIRIIGRHAIPNMWRASLVYSTADFILNIMLIASLSFLGLGIQPPTAEWGAIIAEGQYFLLNAWWISTLPGLALVGVGVGLSLVGDAMAERIGLRFRLIGGR